MNRRKFFGMLSLPVAAATAGCFEDGSSGGDPSDADEPDEIPSADAELDEVVGTLNLVALELTAATDPADPDTVAIDFEAARNRLESATAQLADLQPTIDDPDRQSDLDAIRAYAEILDGMLTTVEALVGATATLDELSSSVSGADLDALVPEPDAFSPLREATTSASAAVETALDASTRADPDRLVDRGVPYERVSDGLDRLAATVGNVETLVGGYESLFEGTDSLVDARDAFAAADLDGAGDALSDAIAAADASVAAFDARPEGFEGAFATAHDRALAFRSLVEGYEHVLGAMDALGDVESALDDGDWEAADSALDGGQSHAVDASDAFTDGAQGSEDVFASAFEEAATRAERLEALIAGYERVVDAMAAIEDGRDSLEDGEYGAAEEEFGSARAALAEAQDRFDRSTASGPFEDLFDRARCRREHLEAAVDAFEASATAARDGDFQTAAERRSDGEEAIDRAGDC